MTVGQVLADIEARIAEQDRHVVWLKDGYLISQPAELFDSEAPNETVTATPGPAIL